MLTLQEIKFSTSIYYQTFTNHSITYLIQYYNCKIFKNIFFYYFGSLKELSIQKVIPVLSSEYIWIKKSTILLHSLQLIVNHIDKHNKQKKPDNKWTLNSIIFGNFSFEFLLQIYIKVNSASPFSKSANMCIDCMGMCVNILLLMSVAIYLT